MRLSNVTKVALAIATCVALVAVFVSPDLVMGAAADDVGGGIPESAVRYDLYAGKSIEIGYLEVSNDADSVFVKYVLDASGWYLTETHLAINDSVAEIPMTKGGSPIPGKFPVGGSYSSSDMINTAEFVFDLGDAADGDILIIAAHAAVVHMSDCTIDQCETAWAAEEKGSIQFSGKNWATYVEYEVRSGWMLIDSFQVDSADIDGTTSSISLVAGKSYIIKVTGTYLNKGQGSNGEYELCDPAFMDVPPIDGTWKANHPGYPDGLLEMQINGQDVDLGVYHESHQYSVNMVGNDAPVVLRIFDGDQLGPADSKLVG